MRKGVNNSNTYMEALGDAGDNDAEKEDKIIRNISKVALI